ncbi:trihelix transcription factor PTL [Fagus crenata]
MEDHHQYGIADLRQLMNGTRSHFPSIPEPQDLFSSHHHHHHRNLTPTQHQHQQQQQHYEMMMLGRQQVPTPPPPPPEMLQRGLHDFRVDNSTSTTPTITSVAATTTATTSTPSLLSGLDTDTGCLGGDASTGRWPRQETLTLLEIRSRLDPKFKEANQKGPLWDEVSRIMSDEHGYQRSGKKCREKFENLYKYYKKTKEGKAGRQDGKHYRFFRQLEALYGETSNTNSVPETHYPGHGLRFHSMSQTITQANQEAFQPQKHCDSLSLSNSSEYGSSSSDDNDLSTAALDNDSVEKRRKRKGGRSWKAKIKDFIDSQMRKLMEKQEAWLEKLMKTLEQKEQERMLREEEWRKQEADRIDREHKFWAKERAWIEARDAALMEALQKLTGSEVKASSSEGPLMAAEIQNQSENQNEDESEILNNGGKGNQSWPESEIMRLIQLRSAMEFRFRQSGCSSEEVLWEEIAGKMASLGYDRSGLLYKDKWESINDYQRRSKEGNKKRKENSRSCGYFQNNESSLYNQGGAYCEITEQEPETVRVLQGNNDGSSPSNSNAGNSVHESCFPFLMGDGENLWENYGLKLNKGNHNQ